MRNSLIYLSDILEAMEKIGEFTAGMSYEEFCNDDKTISAVRDKITIEVKNPVQWLMEVTANGSKDA